MKQNATPRAKSCRLPSDARAEMRHMWHYGRALGPGRADRGREGAHGVRERLPVAQLIEEASTEPARDAREQVGGEARIVRARG